MTNAVCDAKTEGQGRHMIRKQSKVKVHESKAGILQYRAEIKTTPTAGQVTLRTWRETSLPKHEK